MHAEHLEAKFGVGPHTISVPRIRPADDIDINEFPEAIVDSLFKKIVALIRISTPYTGMKNAILMAKGFSCWLLYVSSPV